MDVFHTTLRQYLEGLDGPFMLTFIFLAYLFNTKISKRFFAKLFKVRIRKRNRTLLVGLTYVAFLVYSEGNHRFFPLLKTLLFSMLFHKLVLEQLWYGCLYCLKALKEAFFVNETLDS